MKKRITKEQFNRMLKESINEVMLEEGFFDDVKSFGKNLKRGYDSFSRNYGKTDDKNKEGKSKMRQAFDKAKDTYKNSDRYEKLVNLSKTVKEYMDKGLIVKKGKESANNFLNMLMATINSMKNNARLSAGRGKGEGFKDMNYIYKN